MNVQAHMSGQAAPPNQGGGSQLPGLPQHQQMQNPATLGGMDPEMETLRKTIRDKICEYLQRRTNPNSSHSAAEWRRRLPELSKRLEEIIFKQTPDKSDYFNMMKGNFETRVHYAIRAMQQSAPTMQQNTQAMQQSTHAMQQNTHAMQQNTQVMQQSTHAMQQNTHAVQQNTQPVQQNTQVMSHHITSSSNFGTMIPTPGITQGASSNARMPYAVDNTALSTGGAGMVPQTTNIGSISNGYQHSPANVALSSAGNSGVAMGSLGLQRQVPHMIPTPGFNNQQTMPVNPEYSNEAGYFNGESTVAPQAQHQKQYTGNQGSHALQHLGGHIGSGVHSGMPQNSSTYGSSDGHMNGGMGLHGSNMPLANGPAVSEGYMNITPYGSSPKPLQQHFNQHPPQRIATSVDMAVSGSFYSAGSSPLSGTNNLNMNAANMQSKSRTNPALLTHQSNVQPTHIKNQMLDHQEKANFQSSQLTHEQSLRPQQPMQHHQLQPNQSHPQFVQNQYHLHRQQQNQQPQQILLRSNSLRQSPLGPSRAEQVMPEHGILSHNELMSSQPTEHTNLPDFQGQYQQRGSYDNAKGGQLFGHLPSSQNFHVSVSHDSQPLLPPHQQSDDALNEVSYLLRGTQPEPLLQPQWRSQPMEKAHITDNSSLENQIQEDLRQRTMGQDEAQQPFTSDWHLTGSAATSLDRTVPKLPAKGSERSAQQPNYRNQVRLLLFLHHAKSCPAPRGKCEEPNCVLFQELVKHFKNCSRKDCSYKYCTASRKVVNHFHICRDEKCPVCSVTNAYLRQSVEKSRNHNIPTSRSVSQQNSSQRIINGVDGERMEIDPVSVESFDDQPTSTKRLKRQPASPVVSESEISPVSVPLAKPAFVLQEVRPELSEQNNKTFCPKREVDVRVDMRPTQEKPALIGYGVDGNLSAVRHNLVSASGVSNDIDSHVKQEIVAIDKETKENALEVKHETNDPTTDSVTASKSGKPKIKGVSLTELFTPEQIKDHIVSLRQWVGQSKAKAEKNQAMEHAMSENSCQLCAVEKLTFEPPPLYCSPCGARIKRNAMYYTGGTGETRHYFCIPCYNESRGDTIEVEGIQFLKAKLEKKRNDEETEEWWVQCDKCEAWQHQICALFNGRRNDGGQAEYTCPNCYIQEIENGERKPLPQSAVLGAKDLPKTILSEHIEERLSKRLKQERQDRANHLGKSIDEVPGAEGLVVRVVSSVDKKLDVKPRFLEIFQEENYPTEFPYKSKAVLLFQRIEGVEVCLFGMYVQEFGAECALPNQRRVYLSYLDSVKYFRPEIRTLSGEALRTFVYHEILIGYLEYCKLRGFTSCYIWACPPLKGEDYILYCHPEIQKTPKSDKLREWYLSMLRKATKEDIVVELTNLYDHFFVTTVERKAKVTAARLPYFDGDYWPGAAEDMISQLRQEEDDRKQQKKGKTKKTITKRALKAAGHTDLSGNASKDAMLMQKLGETIYPMKEDFIMVHLQYSCTHCCALMVSGKRWVCSQCKNFYLCDKCRDAEQRLEERERHPSNSRDVHTLRPVEIVDVPEDTKDPDDILESEFFDTRQAFLSLCQGNHYQYDTLRRAKHSSMMVLYHLHNPTAPAFVTTCNVCHHDIEAGQGWRCEICPDFDVCTGCYQKEGGVNHPHKLTNHPSALDRDAQNKEARQKRVLQLRKMLDLLVHASACRSPQCQYPNCRKVKGLFRHGIQCKIRASGGCVLCKKMWYILQLHARACKESECNVPRCRDLKEHLRRLQQQSDSRRRAAVNEMMRQRAAEVAGGNE